VDRWCRWKTQKNQGIFLPETRLYMMLIPFMITFGGCLLFGYAVQNAMSWVALFAGYLMQSVALTAVPTITMAYVSDCTLAVNSDTLLLVNGLKNVVAFGFLYGVVPWSEHGYLETFGTLAGVFVAILGLGGVVLVVFGARLRHASAQWRLVLE
jgi:hypothetical protein